MKSFLKYVLATVVGFIIMGIFLMIAAIGFVSAIIATSGDQTVKIDSLSILHLKLDQPIVDRGSGNPFDKIDFIRMRTINRLGLNEILDNISKAEEDDNIKGIYLDFSMLQSGIATIDEIRNALLEFKESGKFIVAYGDYFDLNSYYLATSADKIYMNPEGGISFDGLSANVIFMKGLLDKIGVEAQIIKKGKFKSAVEPFILDKMSEANREQTSLYVSSIWNYMVKNIAESRNLTEKILNNYADSLYISTVKSALKYRLVDSIMYHDEIIKKLKELSGIPQKDEIKLVSLSKYQNVAKKQNTENYNNKIAVIYASGTIQLGEGDNDNIGSQKISEAIRKARKDNKVKAIVFRINSPGGSALASDIIWREVVLAQKVKPVIVSMGDLAASGGYYVACAADTIIANPLTLTGSIGVFGILPNAQKLLNQKLGITIDKVNTNRHSDMGNMARPLQEPERKFIQDGVDSIYQTFISHVSAGRGISTEKVDEIGQGCVWSGINAKEIGLIDEFGGITRAIEVAAEKAGLKEYKLLALPEIKDPMHELLGQLMNDVEISFVKNHLGDTYKYFETINQVINMQGIQARLPFFIEIK